MHNPGLIPAWSWEGIVASYRDLVEVSRWPFEPMVAFVEQVAASRYAAGLYPGKSMVTLIIGQTPQFPFKREVLEVEFLPGTQRFRFDFWEDPYAPSHWTRECGPTEAFALLERVLEMKRWFLTTGPEAQAEPSAA